jgi:hypothetical protein
VSAEVLAGRGLMVGLDGGPRATPPGRALWAPGQREEQAGVVQSDGERCDLDGDVPVGVVSARAWHDGPSRVVIGRFPRAAGAIDASCSRARQS